MMQSCPICGTEVDTLRARAVKVRAGKVVAFCSLECAKAGETQPTQMPEASRPVPAPAVASPPARHPVRTPQVAPAPPPDDVPAGVPVPPVPRESEPVIEILHEPASGVVTSARDERVPTAPIVPQPPVIASRDSAEPTGSHKIVAREQRREGNDDTLARWAMDDEEVARAARNATAQPIRGGRGARVIVAVALVAGAAAAGYWFVVRPRQATTKVAPPAPVAVKPTEPKPPPPPMVTPALAVDRARATLRKHLKQGSPRLQILAARALARTGDRDAVAMLGSLLGKEASEVAQFEIAYALARAGDPRGTAKLADGLRLSNRTDRGIAAEKLALLGDARATQTLVGFLDISQLRVGAAEHLAELSEPRAIKALDQLRADQKASADDRARATIALGMSGRTDVAAELRKLLDDPSFKLQAAESLARLRDASARPILEGQLAIPSLRARAARALRILDPGLDARPLLPPLLDALGADRDVEQVQDAEAILLLAGPAEWAKYQ